MRRLTYTTHDDVTKINNTVDDDVAVGRLDGDFFRSKFRNIQSYLRTMNNKSNTIAMKFAAVQTDLKRIVVVSDG